MFFEVKNLQTNKSKQHLSHFSDSFDSYYSEMIRAEMISGFTPTWYPQRRGVGQHVPGGYGHLVQNCKVKGFRCSRRRLPPQTVLKVSARVEKSVPHYRGDNEFSILAGGTFTFKTVSPVQICSGLKDRGCLARPSGRIRQDSREQNCSGLLPELDVGANLWKKGCGGAEGQRSFKWLTSTPTLPGSVSAATLSFMVAHRKLRIVVVVAEV